LDREKAIGHNPKWKLRDDAANWPTPVEDGDRSKNYAQGGRSLGAESRNWPTPTSDRHGPESKESKDARGSGGIDLQTATLNWATPTSRDWKDGACGPETWGEKGENSLLGRQVQRNVTNGPESSGDGQNSLPHYLNPAFVEYLQGFPIGWTAFEPLETPCFLSWRRRHSSFLRESLDG
jgi:hypothetical protein